jgi:Aspartyl/Asparaginyl beta-hydroxylase
VSQDDEMSHARLCSAGSMTPSTDDQTDTVTSQVRRVGPIDHRLLERVRHEVLTAVVTWTAEYDPYQSGGWWTASLMNETGEEADVEIRDCEPVATALLRRLPAIGQLLASLDLPIMWVRLARLAPNSFLWEHRDYADLRRTPRRRLHVPLFTNPSAVLVTGGAKINLRVGHVWQLTPTHPHGACNLLGPDRLHLIIDVYGGQSDEYAAATRLEQADIEHLPRATATDLRASLVTARGLAEMGFVDAAEKHLLRLYFRYALEEGQVYDLIVELHRSLGRPKDVARWTESRAALLGQVGHPLPGQRR